MNRYREDAGQRLLPHVIDELGDLEPERVMYEFPAQNDIDGPFLKVTARDYSNAINRASWWLDETLGRGVGFPTLGYTGPHDLRYFILVAAGIKVGYKMLYTSPRNSTEGDIAVIKAADCNTWLVPSRGSNIQRVLEHIPLKTISLPDLEHFLDSEPVAKYDYTKTWEDGRRDPVWVLHTSGSTGHPKPVLRFLDGVASIGAFNLLPKINGRPLILHDYYDSRAYLTFPFYHGAGLANGMLWPIFHGTTIIFGPERPVSLDLMKSMIRRAKPDTIFTAPSLVEEISKDGEFLELLDTVKALAYGGGPASVEAGNKIWKHTKLRISIGATETGWLPCVETDPEDWNYFHFHPNVGFELQDRGGGLYELVIVRKAGLEQWQPVFSTFPDLQEYALRDLFSRHPIKPDIYRYEGRADNVLVLSNGEKIQPHSMELIIGAHPLVRAVVIVGQGKFQASAIIEVIESANPKDEAHRRWLIDELWPSVEEANKSAPTHAKLYKEFILIASPEKPFPRTSKGTVQRGPAIQSYEKELELVYSQANYTTVDSILDFESSASLKISVRKLIETEIELNEFGDDDDFFAAAGLNSLQVLSLHRALLTNLVKEARVQADAIDASLVYRNPTVNLLSAALLKFTQPVEDGTVTDSDEASNLPPDLLSKYVNSLPESKAKTLPGAVDQNQEGLFVILTGSTGSLGSYVLDALIKSKAVREIWCLNRSSDAPTRQLSQNRSQGLNSDFQSHNVHFRQAILSNEKLGLSEADYHYLVQNATHILHTQWQVDFNLTLSSFEPHIKGIGNLIGLAIEGSTAEKTLSIFFTSSIGVANRSDSSGESIAEKPLTDWSVAGSGYGESKLVAENLLLAAHQKNGIDATICRVGQIAGPVKAEHREGLWNRKEWFPSIIDASAHISLLPESLGRNERIDWIPVDLLSSIVLELAGVEHSGTDTPATRPQIVHAVNPKKANWTESILPIVLSRFKNRSQVVAPVEVVPLKRWVEELRKLDISTDGKSETDLSAVKLVPFYTNLSQSNESVDFETIEGARFSKGLRDLGPVGAEWVNTWLDQWGV